MEHGTQRFQGITKTARDSFRDVGSSENLVGKGHQNRFSRQWTKIERIQQRFIEMLLLIANKVTPYKNNITI